MRLLRSLFAWTAFAIATAVCGTLALFVAWIPPRGHLMWPFARIWSKTFLWTGGIRIKTEGPEVPGDRPFVYVSNHESLLDIPAIFFALPRPARFLAKKILFYIPWVGWNMWLAGFIPVDRANRKRAARAIDAAARRMQTGAPILVFAEETRSPEGTLLPFQRGGFLLAMKARLPIVPVGIDGTRRLLKKGGFILTPGTVTVRWGEPIETASLHHRDRDELIRRVRAEVQRLRGGGEIVPKDVATDPGKEELRLFKSGEENDSPASTLPSG